MMNRVEMNENMMKKVNGGLYIPCGTYETNRPKKHIHQNCGGEIINPGLIYEVYCSRCGETHDFLFLFDYYDVDKD